MTGIGFGTLSGAFFNQPGSQQPGNLYPSFRNTRIEPQNDTPRKYEVSSKILGISGLNSIELASKYVQSVLEYDRSTPILDESTHLSNPVNYFYNKNINGLGPLNTFEKVTMSSIPDKVLEELKGSVNNKNLNLGLFHELNKAWIINGNKLILWDYLNDANYSIIDEIPHDILAVKLIKPKPNTFVDSVKHLLIVSTSHNIYILAVCVKPDGKNELEIFNSDLSVSVNSINANNFICFEKTGQIFFTGYGDELNIWELTYSSDEKWFDKKCNKKCLTRSNLSYLLPSTGMFGSTSGESAETVISLQIDESRDVLYTLSSKSVIRAYTIKKDGLDGPYVLRPSQILTDLRTTACKGAKLLAKALFNIVSINVVTKNENDNLYLVAITQGGCRIYFNGALYGGKVAALRFQNIKFPPSKLTVAEIQQQIQGQQQQQQLSTSLLGTNATLNSRPNNLLEYQKESPILVNTTSKSKIISPGIFVAAVQKTKGDQENNKLFVSVPDYGILNYYHEYIENATFLETYGVIYDIVQLTPSVHATNTPKGYANYFASQYTSIPLHIAVLTNKGVAIYKQRTPSSIFTSLGEQLLPFVERYSLQEACSTALSIICNDKYSESIKLNTFNFFVGAISNYSFENKPVYEKPASLTSTPLETFNYSFEHVKLSPRFYGITLLVSRIFRDIWAKQVFLIDKNSFLPNGTKNEKHLTESKQFLSDINIEKAQVIGFLNTVVVLIKFFDDYGNRIPYFSNSLISNRGISREEETSMQAEYTALNSIYEMLKIMKEAFSFLLILFDESLIVGFEDQSLAFKDTIKFISLETQEKLAKLKFSDLFSLTNDTKDIVKDVFTSIINKNIAKGVSVDYLADSLQKHCSSFCSANDVIIFRAFEHLRKANSIGSKDNDVKLQELSIAVKLLKNVGGSLTIDNLKEAVSIMIKLDYYPEVIEFVLDIANIIDKDKLAIKYLNDGQPINDERRKVYNMKIERFKLIFDILVEIDIKSIQSYENFRKNYGNDPINLESTKLRDQSYALCFKYNDKLFHYEFYDWFVAQDLDKKLLEIDTPFILSYLKERSVHSAEICYLLSRYYSKRQYYYESADVFYKLATSDFALSLDQRIEYLAKASGFCNCVEQFNLRQQTVELLNNIQNNLDVAGIQLELVNKLQNDTALTEAQKNENIELLNKNILDISQLYNEFADPLGYDDLCLIIFKESDYRNFEEIHTKWDHILEKIKSIYDSNSEMEPLGVMVSNVMIQVGKRVHDSEFVFPIPVLIEKMLKVLSPVQLTPGIIVDSFIKSGVSYSKLYYILKEMIEINTSKDKSSIKNEMVYLIQNWWQNDSRLKEFISSNEVLNLSTYSISNDPINKYINELNV
ncbi:Nup170 protein [Saccharomycopsis crataegensis]|uniref:Nup170 protein n=1 Tax=Saccharomycopsis crataegensis TaxID=43959 RepID=A0AAV5QWI2_9ASCO|nr:Nup170 protein [Saccharomycopsis crataegensis]